MLTVYHNKSFLDLISPILNYNTDECIQITIWFLSVQTVQYEGIYLCLSVYHTTGHNVNGLCTTHVKETITIYSCLVSGLNIMKRGVKKYFREPWLGFYFYCEPWIVSYFLREPWIDIPLFSLWFVNWVLFSSWTVNWILYFPCDSWLTSFLFPWTVNFAYYLREFSNVSPKIHMSFIVMIRNWFLMFDIALLFSEMWRRLATISYLKLNYESWHNACTSDFKTRFSKGGFREGGGGGPPPSFFKL